jgi:hypothetical protein
VEEAFRAIEAELVLRKKKGRSFMAKPVKPQSRIGIGREKVKR